jgi:hypothetical protein
MVGPRAGESIGELTLAISAGLTTSNVTSAIHPYPTYNDALWNAAIADVRFRLNRGIAARVISILRTIALR